MEKISAATSLIKGLSSQTKMTEHGSDNDILTKGRDIEEGGVTGRTNSPMAEGGNNHGHVSEIDTWIGSLEKILDDVPTYMCNPGHPGRITRIPETLREVNVKAYEPCFLSVGPYHHGKPSVQPMENRKLLVLNCILEMRPDLKLRDYLIAIKSVEPEARSFYSDVEMDSEQFVQMLLLDSLFILTVFCGMPTNQETTNQINRLTWTRGDGEGIVSEDENKNEDSHILLRGDETGYRENNEGRPRWCWTFFQHDLFLIENQIPFFVLKKIYTLAYGGHEKQLIGTIKARLANLLANYTNIDSEVVLLPEEEIHHLLHLCHLFFRPVIQPESTSCQLSESNEMFRLGCALQLYEAGVKFEARSDSIQHSLLDVIFDSSGKLVFPYLYVDDNTDSLLRNLVALEQMKYPNMGLNVSAYVVLLLHLVTIPEDVELMRRKGLIQHHLASDKEMVYLINRLSVGLSFDYLEDKYSLKPLFQELRRYTNRRVPRWRAWLKHRYFNNPWTIISLLAASILLLLSIVETYYTVISYYQPRLGN